MNTVEVIQPTITKTHAGMTTGIRVKYECYSKAIAISHVATTSPFYGILPEGYHLIAVNEDYSITTVEDAVAAIKACQTTVKITAVSIPVQAGLCRLTNVKRASPTDVRLDFTQTNLVRVANISSVPGSFSNSPIEQGDIILFIENKVVSNPAVAARLLQDVRGDTTASILFVPLSRLQNRAIYGSAPKLVVTAFNTTVPNKTYTLELARCRNCLWKVEFVDFYTFHFEEGWLQLYDMAERSDWRDYLGIQGQFFRIKPLARIVNKTMMDTLCRLDSLVGFYSSSHGTHPDLTIAGSLEKLADLKSRNLLTDEEFRTAKVKVLGVVDEVHALPHQAYSVGPSQEATVVGIVEEDQSVMDPSSAPLEMFDRIWCM